MKIHCHDDADGVTAALFVSFHCNAPILVKREFGDISDWEQGDIMVDMRPRDPNIEGVVYDHHPRHPENRKYHLIWDNVPASLITFRTFKEDIPKQQWWKLTIGLGGDNQLNLTPPEVFMEEPQLLYKIKTWTSYSYGSMHVNYFPVYRLLSSYVNALLRTGRIKDALSLITLAQRPLDIINSPEAKEAREVVKEEIKKIMSDCEVINLKDIHIIIFQSNYKLTGYLASLLEASKDVSGSTIMAINRKDGSISIRGDLALYIKYLLSDLKYVEIDGHPGFMGGKVNCNPHILIDELALRL